MALLALGVVYGDIGTSPLYTLKECVHVLSHGHAIDDVGVMQLLSMISWSLIMVVTVKYVMFILRADNKGEGGIFALLALLPGPLRGGPAQPLTFASILVVIGAALLYGDGAITPAISVLSAVEGIIVAAPTFEHVMPLTVLLLVGLFLLQSKGTHVIGLLFGPVMTVWFVTIAVLGAWHIWQEPAVLQALSPHHAVRYFADHGLKGGLILGGVILCVTGGEALYADLGHFGRKPITRSWLLIVLPALVLNYFGQGALLMRDPTAVANPFFLMVPPGNATYALVALSTCATVIASQGLISGAFSLTQQAVHLGLFPRVTIKHTSHEHGGQVYIPEVNAALAVTCVALVLVFRESSRLVAAFGIAVAGTMALTSVVFFIVLITTKKWPLSQALPLLLLFLSFDLPFLVANLWKIADGGYVPLLFGVVLVGVMLLWHHGRRLLAERNHPYQSFEDIWPELHQTMAQRTPGLGVFLAANDKGLPPILAHHVRVTHALHRQVVLLTVVTADVPRVDLKDRVHIEAMSHGFSRVHVFYGYMEQPDVPRALHLALVRQELDYDEDDVTWYLAREHLLSGGTGRMGVLAEKCFSFLHRNAVNADRHFRIPADRVVEIGTQIDL